MSDKVLNKKTNIVEDPFASIFGTEENPEKSDLFNYIEHLRENKSLYDNVRIKEKVKEMLAENKYLLTALNTDSDNFSVCYGKYILPFYLLVPTQKMTDNYICYETSFAEVPRYNDTLKYQQITFNILCKCTSTEGDTYDKNIIDPETGFARHDLISILLIEQFNWSNAFGFQVHLVSDQSRPVDNGYCARTLVFEQTSPNSLMKDGRIINKIGG